MKSKLSKSEAQEKIAEFFQKTAFLPKEVKKIKRLAMKFKIPLKEKRKLFCKSCLNKLKGETRLSKTHKTILCETCKHKNKFKI